MANSKSSGVAKSSAILAWLTTTPGNERKLSLQGLHAQRERSVCYFPPASPFPTRRRTRQIRNQTRKLTPATGGNKPAVTDEERKQQPVAQVRLEKLVGMTNDDITNILADRFRAPRSTRRILALSIKTCILETFFSRGGAWRVDHLEMRHNDTPVADRPACVLRSEREHATAELYTRNYASFSGGNLSRSCGGVFTSSKSPSITGPAPRDPGDGPPGPPPKPPPKPPT